MTAKPKPEELAPDPPKAQHRPAPLDHIVQLLPAFQPARVKSRVSEFTRGGHRSRSFSEGRGSGETPSPVAIRELNRTEDWQPEAGMTPDPVVGLADPTDREILDLDRTYRKELAKAEAAILAALKAQDRILARADLQAKRQPDPVDECLSCARHEIDGQPFFSPRADEKSCGEGNVLCTWCDDWLKANDDWPPIPIVALRAQGRNITTKQLKELGYEVVQGSKNRVVTIVIRNESKVS